MRRLSVFAGGWTLDAAEAVCSFDPIREWEVLDLISSLVEKSLVIYQPNEERYRMLETIRQYMADRVEEERSGRTTSSRHLDFFTELAESAEPELTGPLQAGWMDRLEADHDNLRSALNWARNDGTDRGLRLAGAIWRFWDLRGYSREGRQWLSSLLEKNGPANESRAKALFAAGEMAFRSGDVASALPYQDECLAIARMLADRALIARALITLGNTRAYRGEYEISRSHHEESLAISRVLGDKRGIAVALNNLGNTAANLRETETAQRLLLENLEIRRELGDERGIAITLNNLGEIGKDTGEFELASSYYSSCPDIHRRLGNRRGTAVALSNLGNVAVLMNQHREAEPLLVDSLDSFWQLGDLSGVVSTLESLAAAFTGIGRLTESITIWGSAERIREDLNKLRPPDEADICEKHIAFARAQADDSVFTTAWEEGRLMSIEQAVHYALSPAKQP